MGFFDFLNLQGGKAPAPRASGPVPTGALTSTRIVQALLALPREARTEAWTGQFLTHVADAAFWTREPGIVQGAGLPFFALYSTGPEPAHPGHVLHHMLDDFLLEQGLGAVINPSGAEADWAFSYGDLLQFHLHGRFYPEPGEAVPSAGAPPADRLPPLSRAVLRRFLAGLGVPEARFMISAWDHAGSGSLELLFDFRPKDFKSLEAFHFAMSNLSWFLPRNYSYAVAGNPARESGTFEAL